MAQWLAFFLAWLMGVAAAAEAQVPLFPPGSIVVFISGLAGDSESESAYDDQAAALLQLSGTSRPLALSLLCDNPEALHLPPDSHTRVLKADRESFLGIGSLLKGTAARLVVVAWGHAGRQGSTPVFHVSGPRLTPKDFSALADQAAAGSQWILMFRGSGLFAREMAGPGRRILSSDLDGRFTSDPTGMALLLSRARAHPSATLDSLAEDFGHAVVSWYEERHLARTEEPTFWDGAVPPRSLASASAPKTSEPAKTSEQKSTASEVASADAGHDNPTNSASAGQGDELSGIWKRIKKVPGSDFPDADGVILWQGLSCMLGNSPALTTERDQFIQVLSAEGKDLGDFDLSYSPRDEELEFLACEVLGPDGKVTRLDPDAVNEAREPEVGDYQGSRRKFFSLPGSVPGAVLHIHYRSQWQKFPLPHISLELPLVQDLPALTSTLVVRVPNDAGFHFGFEAISAPDPKVEQGTYSTSYTWQFPGLPAPPHEPLTPPRRQPRLLLSTFKDWKGFSEWYGRVSQLADEVTPPIAAKAAELTRGATTQADKVQAIYNYVSGLRYVAIPLGVNSFRPHAAANVLQNQFGDCKDKANLFNALLHSVGVEAHLVLVPRFSQAYDDIPGLAFNHAISLVTLAGRRIWADTTDEICRFGLLPPGDSGRKVLVVDGLAAALTQLPAPVASEHRLELKGQVNCSGDSDAIPLTLTAAAFGFPDYDLRAAARETKDHRGSRPLLGARYHPVAGAFALEQQHATAVSALDEAFVWHAQGTCLGLVATNGGSWQMHSPFWTPSQWDVALGRRRTPLFLNEGYPLTLTEEFEMALPAQAHHVSVPNIRQNRSDPLRWRVEWARVADDKITAKFHAELARGDLSEADTPLFQQQLRGLLTALGADASFSLTD